LKLDFLDLLYLDNLLKLLEIFRLFIEITSMKLLLVLLLFLADDSGLLTLRLLFCSFDPTRETRLLNDSLLFEFLNSFLFLSLLLLTPGHNDVEYRLALVSQVPGGRHAILEKRHRVQLWLEKVRLAVDLFHSLAFHIAHQACLALNLRLIGIMERNLLLFHLFITE
jgi:hypothetical protein